MSSPLSSSLSVSVSVSYSLELSAEGGSDFGCSSEAGAAVSASRVVLATLVGSLAVVVTTTAPAACALSVPAVESDSSCGTVAALDAALNPLAVSAAAVATVVVAAAAAAAGSVGLAPGYASFRRVSMPEKSIPMRSSAVGAAICGTVVPFGLICSV
jgi:hypothetical protein